MHTPLACFPESVVWPRAEAVSLSAPLLSVVLSIANSKSLTLCITSNLLTIYIKSLPSDHHQHGAVRVLIQWLWNRLSDRRPQRGSTVCHPSYLRINYGAQDYLQCPGFITVLPSAVTVFSVVLCVHGIPLCEPPCWPLAPIRSATTYILPLHRPSQHCRLPATTSARLPDTPIHTHFVLGTRSLPALY